MKELHHKIMKMNLWLYLSLIIEFLSLWSSLFSKIIDIMLTGIIEIINKFKWKWKSLRMAGTNSHKTVNRPLIWWVSTNKTREETSFESSTLYNLICSQDGCQNFLPVLFLSPTKISTSNRYPNSYSSSNSTRLHTEDIDA